MTNPHFKIGGVPEHFNYPWYIAAEHELRAPEHDISFEWQAFPGGTGAMGEALRKGEIDIALMLTEGAVSQIVQGNPSRIIGTYVNSPLTWGIHVSAGAPFTDVESLRDEVFAISRYQSGSHLMAYVNAEQRGWDPQQLNFATVGGLEGAREALSGDEAQAFMWEKFTTKPLVDSGEWRRVGECVTPWPCFVLVAREEICEQYQAELLELMYRVRRFMSRLSEEDVLSYISERFELQRTDVEAWYAQTEWYCAPYLDARTLHQVQQTLEALEIIEGPKPVRDICAPFCVSSEQGLSAVMYNWRVESVYKALQQKEKHEGPLALSDLLDLGHLDQYHYLGADACYEVAEQLQLKAGDEVYDIGSGVGGTARVIADCSGCRVLGVELQPELCRLSTELTRRVGLDDKVSFKAGDFLDYEWHSAFDHFISLLVFLHLPDRGRVLQHCHRSLKPGGQFFIEDFVARRPLTDKEQSVLRNTVSAVSITSAREYRADLEQAGFSGLELEDMSEAWTAWTEQRYQAFRQEAARHRELYGEALYSDRLAFYETIAELFAAGNLGGIRITGRKTE